jgi:glycosyltransferase involved in cell wall biosynthesis
MRLAFVDLLFSWPANGGADVDLFHVLSGLRAAGQDVHLVGVAEEGSWERGAFDPVKLPFPARRLEFPRREINARAVPARVREAVDALRPDAVIVADGFFLKPWVTRALEGYPVVSRFYAYEDICHRDILHFRDGEVCPLSYLETPDACRRCALAKLGPEIRADAGSAWMREYLGARAYDPAYHAVAVESLRALEAAIVSNPTAKEHLAGVCRKVFVVPGGVDPRAFPYSPPASKGPREGKVILMAGRAEDPVKGLEVLRAAGEELWRARNDFVIWATLPEDTPRTPWFRPVGWRGHAGMAALYRQADIVVAPSVWDEPFGLVALEAMATGRPVCASRVGGLQQLVRHLETGFLFPRGDASELARQLALLLDNPEMRAEFGKAGRTAVESEHTWPRVIARHYMPFLAWLAAAKEA